MASNLPEKSKQDDPLSDLIGFFAATVAHLPEVKLDKLIYIAHLYYFANRGELLTTTRFFSLSYGPHAPILRSALSRLIENKSLSLVESRTSPDPVYSNPCLIIKACGPRQDLLSSSRLNTLQEVLKDWGDKPYEPVLDYVTRTLPHLSTPYREPIDWAMSLPHPGLKTALPHPERVSIHRFVEKPEAPVQQSKAFVPGAPLSVQEVAEIYLAVCGEKPGDIPCSRCLGFDLPSVFHALCKGGDAKESDPRNYGDDIEKAAQIADSLLAPLSFKAQSARVALQSGMFFLRKQGYSFDGNVLDEHWPEEHSYEFLKKWFGRVSVRVDTKQKSC